MKTYRVEICEIKSGKVVSVVGRGLSENKADRRLATALSRIDTFNYFVQTTPETKSKGKKNEHQKKRS